MTVLRLALASLRNRWLTAGLTILAIAFSVMLLLGVEKVRHAAKSSFANTISGTDLIVGARSGGIQLLLYAVFRIGNATNNVSWRTYEHIAARPEVDWIVPLTLGDTHRGFRVLGTSRAYFDHYRYGQKRPLQFATGAPFRNLYDAVIGADVARALGYRVGSKLVVAHGSGGLPGTEHDDKPFTVAGVLAKTGTPVDRTVHVSMEAYEAIHIGWQTGTRQGTGAGVPPGRPDQLKPKTFTAALVGLKSKLMIFQLQRHINTYRSEPLLAVMPALTLYELWDLVGTAETALLVISAMVVITAILGMLTMILATLNERRREIAILRAMGAGPMTIVGLLVSEATILTIAGVAVGVAATYVALATMQPIVDAHYGLHLAIGAPSPTELWGIAAVIGAGVVAGLLPAWRAYRLSLADGMMVRS
ncbi:MAG: ABC transporter permease [Hyphomicrobiaceae bacterium]|nr:ABC transporter permease [Hyphomicrobiaceae bacterium]